MNIERDKFLTEAMGSIWDAEVHRARYSPYDDKYWAWFGKLWEWCQTQEWWNNLIQDLICVDATIPWGGTLADVVRPDRFADAVYRYLKETDGYDSNGQKICKGCGMNLYKNEWCPCSAKEKK